MHCMEKKAQRALPGLYETAEEAARVLAKAKRVEAEVTSHGAIKVSRGFGAGCPWGITGHDVQGSAGTSGNNNLLPDRAAQSIV